MFLADESELFVQVEKSLPFRFVGVHALNIEVDFGGDRLEVLIIEVCAISESLNCCLKRPKLDIL